MTAAEPARPVDELEVRELVPGRQRLAWLVTEDAFGAPLRLPLLVVRGAEDGPVVGLTAAIHGDELNGIRVVHRLFEELDPSTLRGTVVMAAVTNLTGFAASTREHEDGTDLNRIMPGSATGTAAEQYAHRLLDGLIRRFDHHFDLHTASFGRVNSYYIRADLTDPAVRPLALVSHADIVLHNVGGDGTLRLAAARLGVPSLTYELGDPGVFQESMIVRGLAGVRGGLHVLGLTAEAPPEPPRPATICLRSRWLYTSRGGLLDVLPGTAESFREGDIIATITDLYGRVVETVRAPEDGVVIGKATNPVGPAGSRILHYGVVGEAPGLRAEESS